MQNLTCENSRNFKHLSVASLREIKRFAFGLQQHFQRCYASYLSCAGSTVHSHYSRGRIDFYVPRGISSQLSFSVLYRGAWQQTILKSEVTVLITLFIQKSNHS